MLGKACILLIASMIAGVYAAGEGSHPLTDLPAPGQVTTGFIFPDHPSKKFTAGKPVTAVLGIHNDASSAYNVTAVLGSLNSPTDFRIYVQNFTQSVYHLPVSAGEELTVEYQFTPDPRLEARDFVVALTVVYHDNKGQYYSSTFFNSTIEIVEVKKLIDWEMIFLIMFLFALAGGLGYLAYTLIMPHLQSMGIVSRGRRTKKTETVARADDSEEWIKGTPYDSFTKRKAALKAKQ